MSIYATLWTLRFPKDGEDITDLDPVVLYGRITGRDPLQVLREGDGGGTKSRRSATRAR